MSSPGPELSSLHTALREIASRVAAIALEQRSTERGEALAAELFAIEGILLTSQRRLARVVNRMSGP